MVLRKTKIVCSIGPSSNNETTIRKLILAGMNVARFNFSHGTYCWHKSAMDKVKRISAELNIPVAILMDTKGPEIRTGNVEDNKIISITEGDLVEITVDGSACYSPFNGKKGHLSLSWKDLPNRIKKGMRILIADGLLELLVERIQDKTVLCTAQNTYSFGSKKNVNLIGIHAGLPILSEQDKSDIAFCVEQNMDFIAASFVSFPEEITQIREYLEILGSKARIIAKIENEEGVKNIDEIIKIADGIMVARGDLGVQIPPENIPLVQKLIIEKCRQEGKPVITATQMLDSMITNPRPTRAELTDVANAVFDGTDAVMLSGETASGKYPIESVKTMSKVLMTTESSDEYYKRIKLEENEINTPNISVNQKVAACSFSLAQKVKATAIIVVSKSEQTALMINRFRPRQTIIAATQSNRQKRRLMLSWGITPITVKLQNNSEATIQWAVKTALTSQFVSLSNHILLVAGMPFGGTNILNSMRVSVVGNILGKGYCSASSLKSKNNIYGKIIRTMQSPNTPDTKYSHIFVCTRITESCIPILKKVTGIIAETGSDLTDQELHSINKKLVWITNVPHAQQLFEEGQFVTIDSTKGIIYEGFV